MWGQCEVLRVLRRYRPQSEGELFDILSLLDASLVSHQPAVMAATLRLFLSLCSGLLPVCLAALERARDPLLAACGSASREMRFAALCHIQVSRSDQLSHIQALPDFNGPLPPVCPAAAALSARPDGGALQALLLRLRGAGLHEAEEDAGDSWLLDVPVV